VGLIKVNAINCLFQDQREQMIVRFNPCFALIKPYPHLFQDVTLKVIAEVLNVGLAHAVSVLFGHVVIEQVVG
jgi:hypothetical protein